MVERGIDWVVWELFFVGYDGYGGYDGEGVFVFLLQ